MDAVADAARLTACGVFVAATLAFWNFLLSRFGSF